MKTTETVGKAKELPHFQMKNPPAMPVGFLICIGYRIDVNFTGQISRFVPFQLQSDAHLAQIEPP